MIILIKDWLLLQGWTPFLGATGVAFLAGPLGCLLMWQRLAFMGDALGHVGLLSAALALFWDTPFWFAGLITSALFTFFYLFAHQNRRHPEDAILAWLTQTALALSAVLFSFVSKQESVSRYLFGHWGKWDGVDLLWIMGMVVLGALFLMPRFSLILQLIVDPDELRLKERQPFWIQFFLLWFSALLVSFAMKMVGALLCAALLVIPQMTARAISKTPEGMMICSIVLAWVAMLAGAFSAFLWGWPTGPTIVLWGNVFFLIIQVKKFWIRKRG